MIEDCDGTVQDCPECGSTGLELIPFVGDQFNGVHVYCQNPECQVLVQIEYSEMTVANESQVNSN